MMQVAFSPPSLPQSGAIAVLIGEGSEPSGLVAELDGATGGALTRAFEAALFKGARGKTCTLLAPGAGLARVVAIGLGKADTLSPLVLEEAGGHAAVALARDAEAAIAADGLDPAQAASVALGAVLRSYRFDLYRTKEKPEDKPKLETITVLTAPPEQAARAWGPLKATAEAIFFARDLVSEPPNVLTPAELAKRCESLTRLGLEVEVLDPPRLRDEGFRSLLAVAQGSVEEPRVVVMRWNGGAQGEDKPLAFIGKGVTFDSGGISIKPAGGMEDMKFDMAGSAAVIGLMAALAGRQAAVNAVGIVGLTENMPSGSATRPGDVVKSLSGQTIEIINTDAEGRLVLADVLSYCQQRFDPVFMVDLATLTGAIIVSLGHEYAGMFSNDDELAARLTEAGAGTGEKVWRQPMHENYDKQIRSEIADMKNIGGRQGGAIIGAQFLGRFVDTRPWAHLDIAGVAWATKADARTPKGATAWGVRLLDRLVATHYEGKPASAPRD
ncbi:MAG: leucyl aminopeptidase [Acetobacteraceae bacterium]|nr:leucyl aminopeptidase [Acetobacteraceae bacterium]